MEIIPREIWKQIDFEKLSDILRDRLSENDIPLGQLAEELEMSRAMAASIVHGQRRPSGSRLTQIIDYLSISQDELPLAEPNKPKSKGNKIFVSYSHKDKLFLDRLMVHLRPLQKQGLIDPWVDTRLQAGDKWKKEIETALKDARVAILLISADFLASDFIIENELPPLLQDAEKKGTVIIPVILKPCRFLREKNLCEFQSINLPDEPVSVMSENSRELTYDTVAQRIEDLFDVNGS